MTAQHLPILRPRRISQQAVSRWYYYAPQLSRSGQITELPPCTHSRATTTHPHSTPLHSTPVYAFFSNSALPLASPRLASLHCALPMPSVSASLYHSLLLVLVVCLTSAACAPDSSPIDTPTPTPTPSVHVSALSLSTFDVAIASRALTLVDFFTPWCSPCTKLAPLYEAAAARLAAHPSPAVSEAVQFATVDCTVETELCERYGATNWPQLKLFRNDSGGPLPDYRGGRTTDDIVHYVTRHALPAFVTLGGGDDSDSDKDREWWEAPGVKIIGVFDSAALHSATAAAPLQAFIDTATLLRVDYSFAVTARADRLAEHTNATDITAPAMVVIVPGEPAAVLRLNSSSSVADLVAFIRVEGFPLVGDIGTGTFLLYAIRGLPYVWVFHDPNGTDSQAQMQSLYDAAKLADVKGKLSVVRRDGVTWADHVQLLSGRRLRPEQLPFIVIENRQLGHKYVYRSPTGHGGLTTDSLAAHFRAFLADELQPSVIVRSADVPADNSSSGAVQVVVGDTFHRLVLDSAAHVFVNFYTSLPCEPCDALLPAWEELAALFSEDDAVVIAKLDVADNDSPVNEQLQRLPTVMLFPAGGKDRPLLYEGDQTAAAMADFVRQHGGTPNSSSSSTGTTSSSSNSSSSSDSGHDEL